MFSQSTQISIHYSNTYLLHIALHSPPSIHTLRAHQEATTYTHSIIEFIHINANHLFETDMQKYLLSVVIHKEASGLLLHELAKEADVKPRTKEPSCRMINIFSDHNIIISYKNYS